MPVQRPQDIYAGAAIIYIGDAFTPTTTDITDNINNALGYAANATALVVDDASTIAPNVWDSITGTLADPPVVDVILNVTKREIMYCWKRVDATETIYVCRGGSKWYDAQTIADESWAFDIDDNDELQLLGTGTFPDWSDGIVFTDEAVTVTSSFEVFDTRDNVVGMADRYTASPGTLTVDCTVPRNMLPKFKKLIGRQAITEISGTAMLSPLASLSAGTKIPGQFLVVVPLEQWSSGVTKTVGGKIYRDHSRSFFIPYAMLDPSETFEYSEGAQVNPTASFSGKKDFVFNMAGFHGWFDDTHRLLKSNG